MRLPLGLTFDDVLLIPQESNIRPTEVDITTRAAVGLPLSIPILSAAMDTISNDTLIYALAREGGMGVLHRNCTVPEQVRMLQKVLRRGRKHCPVAAAVGPHDTDRARALDRAGVSAIVIDCAHAHKPSVCASVRAMRKQIHTKLIIGNIATASAAKMLLPYADALKVGVGAGSICTTRIVAGVGVPQLTAIMDVARVARAHRIPVIADSGIRYSGDIVKALGAGADTVMLGSLFAGTNEAPGTIVRKNGVRYKRYRGMGSEGAMHVGRSTDRYSQQGAIKYVPEGVEALTPAIGALHDVVFYLMGGLRAGMGYTGARSIAELHRRARFIRITESGRVESHAHSVIIEKQAPNYRQDIRD